jgi:hypothetical protein
MASTNVNVRANFQPQSTLAAASILVGYTLIGKLTHPSRMVMISNLTDADLQFSIDGTNDHFPIAKRSSQVFDISTNQALGLGLQLPLNFPLYVKQIGTPTTGSVYFCAMFAD